MSAAVNWLARVPARPWWASTAVGVGCALLMLAVRAALSPLYGEASGFMILLPAVIAASLAGGRVAGAATMICCLVGGWALLGLGQPGFLLTRSMMTATLNFVLVGLFITAVASALRGMVGALERSMDALRGSDARVGESEQRPQLISEHAPVMLWMSDETGRCVHLNAEQRAFWAAPVSLDGFNFSDFIHPDDRADVVAATIDAAQRRVPFETEARFRRQDGEWRILRTDARPRLGPDGRYAGMIGVNVDITETRATEAALAAQERRQTFLLALTDRMRDLATPEEIMADVEQALGLEFGTDRVGYGEVDEDRGLIWMTRDWTAGVVSAEGEFRFEDLGADVIADLATGQLVRIPDVREDSRTQAALGLFTKLNTRALMRAPVVRGGRLRAFLYAHSATVRDWSDAEAELLQEVAVRTWAEIERTRAEAEVRESEERFRAIADTAPVLIWVTQQDGARAFVNQAYVAYDGGTYEEARLANWRAIIHPDDHERIIAESAAGEETAQPFSMEARYLRHDGEYRWLKSFSRPRLGADNKVIGFVGVAFDVTDIREAQARLIESETRFRTVADSAPAQIWMTDDEGVLIFANKRFRLFFDATADDRLETRWGAVIAPRDLEVFRAGFARALEARDRYEGLLEANHPQLGQRWLRCEGVPRFDGDGRFQGYVGANIDVTEAKRAEDDLKRINELLEERVGEAMAEKAKAEADLMHAQRMEAVGRLTGGVAHDFNNLLTVVIGALDIMLRSPEDAAKRQKLGEAALAAARRGEGLTHQLLAFSRRQALRPEAVDLNALIRQSAPLLHRAVGEAIDFKLILRRGGAWVKVDPSQFEAALLNLVVNARDALGDTGRIRIRTQSCTVAAGDVPDLPAGPYVCVMVSDNGSGMAPDVIARVFEPFFTTKAVGKGTGLGLSQVYGFARQSGGAARVSSSVGRGTEIRLYLPPLPGDAGPKPEADHEPASPMAAGRRLLLVEDDIGVAAVALELLEGLGLEVQAVETGAQALERLARESFDIMLSDVVMPDGMTGIELARRCAQEYPDMRVVLTSGYAGEDVDAALADAPWPFLRKPYSGDQLARILGDLTPPESARED